MSTMTRSSLKKWKWPIIKDEIFYDFKKIIQKNRSYIRNKPKSFYFEITEFDQSGLIFNPAGSDRIPPIGPGPDGFLCGLP